MTEFSPTTVLPVITHMTAAYKEWYGFRDSLPKKSRYTLGDKIDRYFIQVLEVLYMASYQSPNDKLPTLQRALTTLDTLKFLVQIAWEVRALDTKKYASLSEKLQSIGKEVGGWRKGIQTKTSAG